MDEISILLAVDFPIVREGLRSLIGAQADMAIVAEADDGVSGCEMAAELGPDVLIVDTPGRRTDAIVAAMRPLSRRPKIGVLVLAERICDDELRAFLKAGARGHVLNRAPTDELLRAIRSVEGGGTYLDSGTAALAVRGFLQAPRSGRRTNLQPRRSRSGIPRSDARSTRPTKPSGTETRAQPPSSPMR